MTTWANGRCSTVLARLKRASLLPLLLFAVPHLAAQTRTYVWPDCDTAHPCVVHHIDSVADGTASGEDLQDFKFPMEPSSAGNLLVFTVMHVSSKSITVTDNNNGTWQTAVTTTNAADGQTSELLYICGAAAGTNLLTIHLSQAAVHDEPLHFTYDEVSGVAPTACLDGTAAANGLKGTVQPGPVTTTVDGDIILNYGEETYQFPEYDNPIGSVTADASSALLMENTWDKFASQVSLQAAHGAYSPTLTVNGDANNRNWNSVAAAFKPSAGSGTQPTGIHVTRVLHYVGPVVNPVTLPFPSSGNAIVITTSNPSEGGWAMTNLTDNAGHTWTRTPFKNAALDPQIFSTCLGTGSGGQNLVLSWTPGSLNNHLLVYDVAGALTTGGSTGCVGATVNTQTGTQASTTNAPIDGDPVITPTTPGSAIFATSYFGIGPPSASLTPGVVFNSIWATNMIDASGWDTGDPYAYIYTANTSPISFDWQMANSTGLANGGSTYDGAAIEILPGATTQASLTSVAVTPANPSIAAGSTQQFTATGTYSNATTQDITSSASWTSSAPSIATVSNAGLATALCPGSTSIAASLSSVSGQTSLTVTGLATTTTTLSSSANPPLAGQTVTFTAVVSSACGAPTGTVQFMIDGANYGATVPLNSSTATTTATLSSGTHTIAAVYSGSSTFAGSTSNSLTEPVATIATTTTLVASATQIAQGASVTLTATVAAASGTTAPSGTVSFYEGPLLLGTATLNQGTAALTTTQLPGGTDSMTASYSGGGDFAPSASAAVVITVTNSLVDTTLALTASANQINLGTPLTLTARVAAASGTITPDGSVSFYAGTALLGASLLSGGVATLSTTALPAGQNSIVASYAGSAAFNPSISAAVTIAVAVPVVNTTTSLSIVPGGGTLAAGSPYTLSAVVAPVSGTAIPTGSVLFTVGSATLTVPLNASGVAAFSNNAPAAAGTLTLSAAYQGSTAFAPSTSNVIAETIIAAPTSTSLAASATQIPAGSSVTLTASVASSAGHALSTGSVGFYVGSTLLGAVPVSAGVAALTTTALPVGINTVSATFTGSAGLAASTSSAITINVTAVAPDVPAITTLSPLLTLAGSSGFTLTVTGSGFTSASTIHWGSTALATQFVSTSQLTAQVLPANIASAGITAVTVQTPGLSNSNAFQFETDSAGPGIAPPSFTPASATVTPGSIASFSATLPASATGISAQCLNLPAGTTCSYADTTGKVTVTTASATLPGTYPITVVFTETLPVSAPAFAVLPVLLLPLAGFRRRGSIRIASGILLLLIVGFGLVSGCGSKAGGSSTTTPQSQTVTSSAVVTLTVQ
jgi:hypothetical protein